jgi:hypothetical protein
MIAYGDWENVRVFRFNDLADSVKCFHYVRD